MKVKKNEFWELIKNTLIKSFLQKNIKKFLISQKENNDTSIFITLKCRYEQYTLSKN